MEKIVNVKIKKTVGFFTVYSQLQIILYEGGEEENIVCIIITNRVVE